MRTLRVAVPGLMLALLVGCTATGQKATPGWANRIRSLWAGLGPDAVQLEIALVQQPARDSYLTHELWREIDEQVVPLDLRPALEANGIRVGVISGNVPSGLQRLLTTEKLTCVQGHTWEVSGSANEGGERGPLCPHCQLRAVSRESPVNARRRGIKSGEPFFHPLGPVDKPLKLKIQQDSEAVPLELESAQAGLQFQLTPNEGGSVLVKGEPRIQHGSFLRLPQPSEDKSSWTFVPGRPEKTFPKLAWEVTLEPNDYLVLGCWSDHPDTLGEHCFVQKEAAIQTILVLRVSRPQAESATTAVALANKPTGNSGPLPLALQSILPKRPPQQLTRGQSEP